MPTIVHFEIPVDDFDRAMDFYNKLFGWKIEKFPGPTDYLVISTIDNKGNDALKGGMIKRVCTEHSVTNYIDVPSVAEYVTKIRQLGGKVIVEKMPVPKMGYFAIALDPEGNVFGIWETNVEAK